MMGQDRSRLEGEEGGTLIEPGFVNTKGGYLPRLDTSGPAGWDPATET